MNDGDEARVRSVGFDDAVAALRDGTVVAIPTDTVYGLAVDPTIPGATEALFVLKARPEGLDLPVLVGSMEQAEALAGPHGLSATARHLADACWPGALTIVVARRPGLDWDLGAHDRTIGLRLPDHDMARALCLAVGALATTSANAHGEAPCTTPQALQRVFGVTVPVLDGGRCDGAPSTVASVLDTAPQCLRQGALSWAEVLAAMGNA